MFVEDPSHISIEPPKPQNASTQQKPTPTNDEFEDNRPINFAPVLEHGQMPLMIDVEIQIQLECPPGPVLQLPRDDAKTSAPATSGRLLFLQRSFHLQLPLSFHLQLPLSKQLPLSTRSCSTPGPWKGNSKYYFHGGCGVKGKYTHTVEVVA